MSEKKQISFLTIILSVMYGTLVAFGVITIILMCFGIDVIEVFRIFAYSAATEGISAALIQIFKIFNRGKNDPSEAAKTTAPTVPKTEPQKTKSQIG